MSSKLNFTNMEEIKKFSNREDMIKYARSLNLSKHGFVNVILNDKKIILCGTPLATEDIFGEECLEFFKRCIPYFGFVVREDILLDISSYARDALIELFEKYYKMEFVYVSEEY
jgi:hypothetical protein